MSVEHCVADPGMSRIEPRQNALVTQQAVIRGTLLLREIMDLQDQSPPLLSPPGGKPGHCRVLAKRRIMKVLDIGRPSDQIPCSAIDLPG